MLKQFNIYKQFLYSSNIKLVTIKVVCYMQHILINNNFYCYMPVRKTAAADAAPSKTESTKQVALYCLDVQNIKLPILCPFSKTFEYDLCMKFGLKIDLIYTNVLPFRVCQNSTYIKTYEFLKKMPLLN